MAILPSRVRGKKWERLLVGSSIGGEHAPGALVVARAPVCHVDGDGHSDLLIGAWQHRSAAASGRKADVHHRG